MVEKLLAWIGVYRQEIQLFMWTMLLLFIVRSAGTILDNYADATFLKRYGVEFIPVVNIVNAAITVMVMGFVAGLIQRILGSKLLIWMLLISGMSMALIRAVIPLGLDLIYPLLFMLKAQFGILLALLFWNMANDLFNTQQAKRLFPLVTAGGVVGQILGSFGTPWFARTLTLDNLLLAYSVLTIAGAVSVYFMTRRFPALLSGGARKSDGRQHKPSMMEEFRRVWPMVKESTLIKILVMLTLVPNVVIPIINYQFNYAVNDQFATESGLLGFLSYMRGVLNIISLVLLLYVGKIYGRWGLPVALMFHPFNYILAFFSFLFRFDVFSAVYARMSTQILRTSINVPAMAVLTGLFPQSYRAMIRPFLRGTAVRMGLILGSAIILISDQLLFHPRFLSLVALPLVLVWLSTVFWLKRRYTDILTDLVSGDTSDIKSMETEEIQHLFSDPSVRRKLRADFTRSRPEDAIRYGQLLKAMNDQELDRLILNKLDSADTENQIQLMELMSSADAEAVAVLGEMATGEPPRLQAAAIATLVRLAPLALTGDIEFEPLVHATSVEVRAHAAAALLPTDPDRYNQLIQAWLDDSDAEVKLAGVMAAGISAGAQFVPSLEKLLAGETFANKAAVLNALCRIQPPQMRALAEPYLRNPSPQVRLAAVAAFRISDKTALEKVIPLLGDTALAVSQQAKVQIIEGPFHDGKRLISALSIPRRKLREELFSILDALDIKDLDIVRFVRSQAEGAYKYLVEARAAARLKDSPGRRLLEAHLRQKSRLQVQNLVRVLATQDATKRMRIISRGLLSTNARQRANSQEALADLLDKSVSRIVIPLLDASPMVQKIAAGRKYFKLDLFSGSDAEFLDHLLTHENWVTRVLALETAIGSAVTDINPQRLAAVAADKENICVQRAARRLQRFCSTDTHIQEASMEGPMAISEKILLLNEIEIFAGLSVSELTAIASVTEEINLGPDVQVISDDHNGESLYLIASGKVVVMQQRADGTDFELDQMTSGDYFGEMALFDDSDRSAKVVTMEDTRLLFLHKQDFNEMVNEYPQIALAICGALSRRVRKLDQRLAT